MATIANSLPKGKKIGMAFSGGLDTSAAMLWMRTNGAIPIAYIADLGQCEESSLAKVAMRALTYGSERVSLVDCKRCVAELGIAALQCGAFNVITASRPYYNTTPIGRIAIGVTFSLMMKNDLVSYWSDGSTFKGNDIERFFKYSALTNPSVKFYKPWLDDRFVKELGGRKEMYQFLFDHNFRFGVTDQETYSTDGNLLGNTYEAKLIERLDYNAKDIIRTTKENIRCNALSEVITVAFANGRPISLNGIELNIVSLINALNVIGRKNGIGLSDQVEDRIIGIKSRGIYEAPAMHILFIAYERLITGICDQQTISKYREHGVMLGKMLYDGNWFNPMAIALRNTLRTWVTNLITGEVTLELQQSNDCMILDTYSKSLSYSSHKLSMEKIASEFVAPDRFGQLNMVRPQMSEVRRKVREFGKMGLLHFDNNGIPTLA